MYTSTAFGPLPHPANQLYLSDIKGLTEPKKEVFNLNTEADPRALI